MDVRVILLSSTINTAALVWNEAGISLTHTYTHTESKIFSSFYISPLFALRDGEVDILTAAVRRWLPFTLTGI